MFGHFSYNKSEGNFIYEALAFSVSKGEGE